MGKRVLVAASSNIAVDNLLEACLNAGVSCKCVRLGDACRVLKSVHKFHIDVKVILIFIFIIM